MGKYRIESNSWCKNQITIPIDDFADGIFYAKKKCCDGIYIIPSLVNSNYMYDLNLLHEVSSSIIHLSFNEFLPIKKYNCIEGIYFLNNLKSLFLPSQYETIDMKHLKSIEVLSANSFNIVNIGHLCSLSLFQIRGKLGKNLTLLSDVRSLLKLLMINTNIENLEGIENIKGLKSLELSYNKKLVDISRINITGIEELKIIKCKNIGNLNILNGNESIKELYIDDIENLDFIPKMKNIKTFGFGNVKDGNMNNLIKSPTIESVRFYPNRKHYSHTEFEVNRLLSQRDK